MTSPTELGDADLIVLPGSRATVADLRWLRERGLADAIIATDRPVLGICGGYQMLARVIRDEVESGAGEVAGLGLLPARVEFARDKTLGRPTGEAYGARVSAYEIHHGVVTCDADAEPFPGGCRTTRVWGTVWHGALENDDFRRAFLTEVAALAGRDFVPMPGVSFARRREEVLDALGDLVERHLDTDALLRLLEDGAPDGLPVLPPGGRMSV